MWVTISPFFFGRFLFGFFGRVVSSNLTIEIFFVTPFFFLGKIRGANEEKVGIGWSTCIFCGKIVRLKQEKVGFGGSTYIDFAGKSFV